MVAVPRRQQGVSSPPHPSQRGGCRHVHRPRCWFHMDRRCCIACRLERNALGETSDAEGQPRIVDVRFALEPKGQTSFDLCGSLFHGFRRFQWRLNPLQVVPRLPPHRQARGHHSEGPRRCPCRGGVGAQLTLAPGRLSRQGGGVRKFDTQTSVCLVPSSCQKGLQVSARLRRCVPLLRHGACQRRRSWLQRPSLRCQPSRRRPAPLRRFCLCCDRTSCPMMLRVVMPTRMSLT